MALCRDFRVLTKRVNFSVQKYSYFLYSFIFISGFYNCSVISLCSNSYCILWHPTRAVGRKHMIGREQREGKKKKKGYSALIDDAWGALTVRDALVIFLTCGGYRFSLKQPWIKSFDNMSFNDDESSDVGLVGQSKLESFLFSKDHSNCFVSALVAHTWVPPVTFWHASPKILKNYSRFSSPVLSSRLRAVL